MKINKENGFVVTDMVIAVIAVIIFSGLTISLIYSNTLENIKAKREALAIIYLTETLENIGIASYEEIIEENKETFVPNDLADKNYIMNIEISEDKNEKITKKIKATILYDIGNKQYTYSMERIKVKE